MHVLIITQYFPPETGATQNRLASLVRTCTANSIEVTVLTAMPHYPAGRIFPEYRGRGHGRESCAGATVIRARLCACGSGKLSRVLSFVTFLLTGTLVGLRHTGSVDLILCESPPLTVGAIGLILSRIKRTRLIMNIADLWPAHLIELGAISNGPMARLLTRLEKHLYRRSAAVSGQTKMIVGDIHRRVPDTPVYHWSNGADPVRTVDADERREGRARWGIAPDEFVVGYAGNFGMSQGLELILDAAAMVPDARFVMVGDGYARRQLVGIAERRRLSNVVWVPRQAHDAMPAIWASFDCTVICLRRIPTFRGAVPSKLFEAMAAGAPIILAIEGEAAEIVTTSDCGLIVEPENPEQLAEAVRRLRNDPPLRERLSRNGRTSALNLYCREAINRRYVGFLRSVGGEAVTAAGSNTPDRN